MDYTPEVLQFSYSVQVMSRQGRLNVIDCHVAEFILSIAEGLLAMTLLQLDIIYHELHGRVQR